MRRLLTLAAVVALIGGGAYAAQAQPVSSPRAAAGATLPVSAATPVTVCPGPETLAVPPGGEPVAVPGPIVVGALLSGGPGTLADLVPSDDGGAAGAAATGAQLKGGPAGVWLGSSTRTAAGAVRLEAARAAAAPAQQPPPSTSAVQVSLGRSGDLRGLAATTCGSPTSDAWLVGGGTATGQRARLLLGNPTASPALVDVTLHGSAGAVAAPSGQGVVIPAGGQVALFLDALAPGIGALAVDVTARSGRFVATLHDTLVRGIVPGGVDDVTVSAPAATRQVLAGIVYAAPGTAAVRVAVPGSVDGVVRVRVSGRDGSVELPGGVATVPAGGVVDVPISGIDDGTYTALVDSDVPVVAGAVVSRTVSGGEIAGTPEALGKTVPPSERAWVAAGQPLRGAVALAVPHLPPVTGVGPVTSSLVLASPLGDARFTVREVAVDGSLGPVKPLSLDAGHTMVVPLAASTAGVLVEPPGAPGTGGPLYASLLLQTSDTAGPMVAVVPVEPGPRPAGPAPQVVQDGAITYATSK